MALNQGTWDILGSVKLKERLLILSYSGWEFDWEKPRAGYWTFKRAYSKQQNGNIHWLFQVLGQSDWFSAVSTKFWIIDYLNIYIIFLSIEGKMCTMWEHEGLVLYMLPFLYGTSTAWKYSYYFGRPTFRINHAPTFTDWGHPSVSGAPPEPAGMLDTNVCEIGWPFPVLWGTDPAEMPQVCRKLSWSGAGKVEASDHSTLTW